MCKQNKTAVNIDKNSGGLN